MFEQEVVETFQGVLDYCQAVAKRKLGTPILVEKKPPPAAAAGDPPT